MILTLVIYDEELEREVMNYGTFSQDQIESVKTNEGVEREPIKQTYNPSLNTSAAGGYQPNPNIPEEPMQTSTAETQRFVICPHCGEKIYIE